MKSSVCFLPRDCDVRTMDTVLRTYVSDAIKYQTNPGENLSMPSTQTDIRNPVQVKKKK